ncbi:MAG: hypothetical protein AAGB06_03605 [Verrucomicrobiota bacterium]
MNAFSGKERLMIFGVGFGLGVLLVGFIHNRRAADGPEGTESMAKKVIRDVVSSTGVKPLPEGTPEILRQSRLHSFDVITSRQDGSATTVWNLEMLEGMWPWVRVSSKQEVDQNQPPEVIVMAGDRFLVELKPGVARADLESMVRERNMEYLTYYKGTNQHVIGISPGMPLAIPLSIKLFQEEIDIVQKADFHLLAHF